MRGADREERGNARRGNCRALHADHRAVTRTNERRCAGKLEMIQSGEECSSLVQGLDRAIQGVVRAEPVDREQSPRPESLRLHLPPPLRRIAGVGNDVPTCGNSAGDEEERRVMRTGQLVADRDRRFAAVHEVQRG